MKPAADLHPTPEAHPPLDPVLLARSGVITAHSRRRPKWRTLRLFAGTITALLAGGGIYLWGLHALSIALTVLMFVAAAIGLRDIFKALSNALHRRP